MYNRNLNLQFKTDNDNHYYLDELSKQYHYIHPIVAHILSNNIDSNIKTLSFPIEIDNNNYSYSDFLYYYRKCLFFKKHGIIKDSNDSIFYEEILVKDIEESIANSESIVLEMTENCNLRCVYCTYGELYNRTPFRGHKNLNIQFVIKLISYFYMHYWNTDKNHSLKKNIKISFYGGEPLLRFNDIKKIVEYTRELCNDKVCFEYLMTTNGILINKDVALFLYENNFQVAISIDGDEFGNSYRIFPNGQNSYHSLIQNINLLQKDLPDFFENNVIFSSVLHNRNSVEILNKTLRDKYNKVLLIGNLNPDGVREDMFDDFNLIQNNDYKLNNRFNISSKEFNTIIGCYHPYINSSIYDILLKRTLKRFPTGTCMPLNKKIFISARNLLLPCEKIDFRFNYGNLEDVNDVEKLISEVAKKHTSYLNTIIKNCRKCYINNICDKCIFYIIDSTKGCYDKSQSCKHFCNKTGFQDKMGYFIGLIEREPTKLNEVLSNYKKL